MSPAESAVVYDGLPLSAGSSHGLGLVTAGRAFSSWVAFLDTCTESSPIIGWFSFPDTPGLVVSPDVRRQIESAFPYRTAAVLFRGRAPTRRLPCSSPSSHCPSTGGMAPVWLWFTADVLLLRPETGELWPGQDRALFGDFVTPGGVKLGASSTRLILQAKKSIGLSLSIPQATDADLATVVPWIQAALPLRLSTKHWSRWTLTKRGDSYRGRRIAVAP